MVIGAFEYTFNELGGHVGTGVSAYDIENPLHVLSNGNRSDSISARSLQSEERRSCHLSIPVQSRRSCNVVATSCAKTESLISGPDFSWAPLKMQLPLKSPLQRRGFSAFSGAFG